MPATLTTKGRTPLHRAASLAFAGPCRTLLARGADPFAVDKVVPPCAGLAHAIPVPGWGAWLAAACIAIPRRRPTVLVPSLLLPQALASLPLLEVLSSPPRQPPPRPSCPIHLSAAWPPLTPKAGNLPLHLAADVDSYEATSIATAAVLVAAMAGPGAGRARLDLG